MFNWHTLVIKMENTDTAAADEGVGVWKGLSDQILYFLTVFFYNYLDTIPTHLFSKVVLVRFLH